MGVHQPNEPSETAPFTCNVLDQGTQDLDRSSNLEHRYSATANNRRIVSRKDTVSGEEVAYRYGHFRHLMAASTTRPERGLDWSDAGKPLGVVSSAPEMEPNATILAGTADANILPGAALTPSPTAR